MMGAASAVGSDGIVDPAAIAAAVDERTALVSVMVANNEIGTIQPIVDIAAICRRAGVLLHTDATQGLSVLALDVDALGVDLMSLSAHKAYGPKGVGALYVRRGLPVRPCPLLHGGGQESGLRPGTLPTPLCVGFGAACAIIMEERESDTARIADLRDRLLAGIRTAIPSLAVNGAMTPRHPGNLSIRVPGIEADAVLASLHRFIAASTGSACTSGMPEPSHVLRAIGLSTPAADSSIRLSLGRQTTVDEVDAAAEAIAAALRDAI